MRLVIGGVSQGKLDFVLEKYSLEEKAVMDGNTKDMVDLKDRVFYAFETWFKRQLKGGGDPEGAADALIESLPELIVICDEVGSGIVPAEPFEREYRERLGRYLIKLAKRAQSVERVFCGIGQRIK
ncbi:MAG: bifunctional adenosylcobinamide kinase/adenosylcobinamide-phosphate guanylyltransferase [Lachnospiraceae bacterium]|nr:bifunctional adenosylcobinamide kinase/adenosylcobinamide-phosphate guanylyltransferase [Lachnospiraceae bacterium]